MTVSSAKAEMELWSDVPPFVSGKMTQLGMGQAIAEWHPPPLPVGPTPPAPPLLGSTASVPTAHGKPSSPRTLSGKLCYGSAGTPLPPPRGG